MTAKNPNQSLSSSEEFVSALLDNVEEGIVACDANGILTLFNRAARQFHGLPEKSVTGGALYPMDNGKVSVVSFVVFGAVLIVNGLRSPEEMYESLSKEVNSQRRMLGLSVLPVSESKIDGLGGLLLTLEDGTPVTFAKV